MKKKKKLKHTIFHTLEKWKHAVSLQFFALIANHATCSAVLEN